MYVINNSNVYNRVIYQSYRFPTQKLYGQINENKLNAEDELKRNKNDVLLERKFRKYSKKANLPQHYVFHSLRHGFATRLVEVGVPLNQVQLLMGHSSLSVTNVSTKARPQDALKNYWELF